MNYGPMSKYFHINAFLSSSYRIILIVTTLYIRKRYNPFDEFFKTASSHAYQEGDQNTLGSLVGTK